MPPRPGIPASRPIRGKLRIGTSDPAAKHHMLGIHGGNMKDDRRSTSATTMTATPARPSNQPRENSDGIPLEAIAQRAYELYASSGFQNGRDVEHWLEAERQLRKDPKFR
jgi:hypothetical protein